MSSSLRTPVGQLASYGIIKEDTFGVYPGAPSIFHGMSSPSFKPQNSPVARAAIRKRMGQTLPGTGAYIISGSLDPESTPDTLGQLLAYALGAQSDPTETIVSEEVSAMTASGATALPVGSSFPENVISGMLLTVDTGDDEEALTVAIPALSYSSGAWSINFTAPTTKSHSAGATITLSSTGAYASTMKLGYLPSFTVEENRVIDCWDHVGCMVDQLSIDIKPKTGLACKFSIVAKDSLQQTDPATPTFSTKSVIAFEHPNAAQYFGADVLGVDDEFTAQGLSITLNNNLDKSKFTGNSGRTVDDFPQGQRSGKATLTAGFESVDAWSAFMGSASGRAPIAVPALAFVWAAPGADIIDATNAVPYVVTFLLPNMFPTGDAVPMKSGAITQTFEADLAESGSGNQDDLSILYVGSDPSVF